MFCLPYLVVIVDAFCRITDYSERLFSKRLVYRVSDPRSKVIEPSQSPSLGQLFVVATPIGNLGDISHRALQVLTQVDCILAEDTRHSKRLLNHYGVNSKLRSCHEHNEESLIGWVKVQLDAGKDLALISDAGTPLISDPGYVLVRFLREHNYAVVAVPGASSIIAALSVAGLPTDGFVYDGFLPAKSGARKTALARYLNQSRTVVVLESSHRIVACVSDVVEVLGARRKIVIARELTKRFETVLAGDAADIAAQLEREPDQTRGEFVLILAGVTPLASTDAEVDGILRVLLEELPVKQAAALAAKLSGKRKNEVYDIALKLKQQADA
jgi:16S rRNA (cytidine1402-2'-O)-methyltransferase